MPHKTTNVKPSFKKAKVQKISYSLQDILKCTPYTSAYTNAPDCGLTEYEFLKNIYINPFIDERLKEKQEYRENILGIEELNEELEELDKEIDYLERLKNKKDNFEMFLSSEKVNSIIYLCGNSGTGKSTYLGYLLNMYRRAKFGKNITCVIDLAKNDTSSIDLFGKTFDNPVAKSTLGKFLFTILYYIVQRMTINRWCNEQQFINNLNDFRSFYLITYYNNNDDFKPIFNIVTSFLDSIQNGNISGQYAQYRQEMQKYTEDKLDRLISVFTKVSSSLEYERTYNSQKAYIIILIKHFLRLFILLEWTCVFNTNKKCYIAFDSIEHYIGDDQVFNSDIVDIANLLTDVFTSSNDFYSNYIDKDIFLKTFRFIIALRDTTSKILPSRDGEDNSRIEIDVSCWFPLDKLDQKRLEYFYGSKVNTDNIIKAILKILEDDEKYSNTLNKITSMHNQNKRRLNEYLCDVLNERAASLYLQLSNCAEEYALRATFIKNSLSDENSSNIQEQRFEYRTYINLSNIYRRASRDLIIRLLLNKIKETGYFAASKITYGQSDFGTDFARKILTYLAAVKPTEEHREIDNYVPFSSLLNSVFKKNGMSKSDILNVANNTDTIKTISEVLQSLSSSSKDHTHWCQNIVIKFNDRNYSADEFTEKLRSVYINGGCDNQDNYGIKITSAGRSHLKRMVDFEYFACLYGHIDDKPLFDERNLEKTVNRQFKCMKIINNVKNHAFNCIDKILIDDNHRFCTTITDYSFMHTLIGEDVKRGHLYLNSNKKELTHAERLIDSHISYLDDYRNYIINLCKTKKIDNLLSEDEVSILSEQILNVISEYVDKLKILTEVSSTNDFKTVYYIGGARSKEDGENYYSKYEESISRARRNILDYCWIKKY